MPSSRVETLPIIEYLDVCKDDGTSLVMRTNMPPVGTFGLQRPIKRCSHGIVEINWLDGSN